MRSINLFIINLLVIATVQGMENSQESFIKIFSDNLASKKNKHEQEVSSWVEAGDPENLDKDFMRLSLDVTAKLCASEELNDILNGLKDPETKELFPRELIFAGPPGTGKTMLALAVAYFLNMPYYLIETIQLSNEYKDSGAQNLWRVVNPILQKNKPSVIIMDEITALTRDHNQEKADAWKSATSLWKLLDKIEKNKDIIFIGTTNNVTEMPPALKSRLSDGIIEVSNPNFNARRLFVQYYMQKFKAKLDGAKWDDLASATENVGLRDLEKITKKSVAIAFVETKNRSVSAHHFQKAVERWRHQTQTLLKINEPQLTQQERLQKESFEFQRKENEENKKLQIGLHDQQVILQGLNSYWSIIHSTVSSWQQSHTATSVAVPLMQDLRSVLSPEQKQKLDEISKSQKNKKTFVGFYKTIPVNHYGQ